MAFGTLVPSVGMLFVCWFSFINLSAIVLILSGIVRLISHYLSKDDDGDLMDQLRSTFQKVILILACILSLLLILFIGANFFAYMIYVEDCSPHENATDAGFSCSMAPIDGLDMFIFSSAPKRCSEAGGIWRVGHWGDGNCDIPYHDTWINCTDSSQCLGECVVKDPYYSVYGAKSIDPLIKEHCDQNGCTGSCSQVPIRICDWSYEGWVAVRGGRIEQANVMC